MIFIHIIFICVIFTIYLFIYLCQFYLSWSCRDGMRWYLCHFQIFFNMTSCSLCFFSSPFQYLSFQFLFYLRLNLVNVQILLATLNKHLKKTNRFLFFIFSKLNKLKYWNHRSLKLNKAIKRSNISILVSKWKPFNKFLKKKFYM
jgi:hypothetical protein